MAYCLGCMGDGFHDYADMDAYLAEHLDDEALARAKAAKGENDVPWGGRVTCSECEGTGVISEDRFKDMMAASTAAIDQIRAKVAAEDS